MGFYHTPSSLYLLLCLLFIFQTTSVQAGSTTKKLYIVYMGEKQHDDPEVVTTSHHEILASILGRCVDDTDLSNSIPQLYKTTLLFLKNCKFIVPVCADSSKEEALGSIVYSYRHGFSGFSAMLTDSQAKEIASMPGVIHVSLSREVRLQTTRSWDFLGVHYNYPTPLLRESKWGQDVIIGIVDSGIWPESKSFSDEGYGPIPSRWKGECKTGEAFDKSNCSRKIIGARWYTGGIDQKYIKEDYLSARDANGHGTHTASTAAGSLVERASFHGLAAGTARGGAPRARLAIYKIRWGKASDAVNDAGVLQAIDDAIHDGVDVLSLSLNSHTVSFGSLHAVAKGITVVYAGGNQGPAPQRVANVAPWVITVAASTVDRAFPTAITLGNNETIVGQGLEYGSAKEQMGFTPIVFGGSCSTDVLNGTDLAGKVVLCAALGITPTTIISGPTIANVIKGGGKGLIFAQYTHWPCCRIEQFPVVLIDLEAGYQILNYLQTVSSPVVKIKPTNTVVGSEVLSPKVATFSSRGPNPILPTVLKPDITAPGVSILAAWGDSFSLGSGTSMATPHIAGVAALLKSLHPGWSPAAVKSAIMTTASVTDAYGWPIVAEGTPKKIADPFDFGAGHVDPIKAMDPGLVYDIDPRDYNHSVHCLLLGTAVCNTTTPAYNLNLPSIAIPDLKASVTVRRMVTNVGEVNSSYELKTRPPLGIEMDVNPKTLVFNARTRVLAYEVTFSTNRKVQGDYHFGSLTWNNSKHSVRIPIAVRPVIYDFYADIS